MDTRTWTPAPRGWRGAFSILSILSACSVLAVLSGFMVGCGRATARVIIQGGPSLDALFADLAREYRRLHPDVEVVCNFVCPPCVLLTKEQDVPQFDIFASLGQFELDQLRQGGRIQFASTSEVGRTPIILVSSTRASPPIRSMADLHRMPKRKVGVGDPETVGVGYYTKQALSRAGLWRELEGRLVYSQSGCELLKWLSLGRDIDAAIVLSVCLTPDSSTLTTVLELPPDVAPPVPLLLAIPTSAANPEGARSFVEFVMSEPARSILAYYHIQPRTQE